MATGFESQVSLLCRVSFFYLLFLKGKTRFSCTLCTFELKNDGFESHRRSLCVYKPSFSKEDAANQQPFLQKDQRGDVTG